MGQYGTVPWGGVPTPEAVSSSTPFVHAMLPSRLALLYFFQLLLSLGRLIQGGLSARPPPLSTPGRLCLGPSLFCHCYVVCSRFACHTVRALRGQSRYLTFADAVPEPRTVHGMWQAPADGGHIDLAMLLGTRHCGLTACPSNPPPQMALLGGGPLEGTSG